MAMTTDGPCVPPSVQQSIENIWRNIFDIEGTLKRLDSKPQEKLKVIPKELIKKLESEVWKAACNVRDQSQTLFELSHCLCHLLEKLEEQNKDGPQGDS